MRQVREAAAPYQTPIEAQPSRSNAVEACSATAQERRAFCGLETHWFPRTVPLNGYDLEQSSDSLATRSGEGQSCGRTRAREQRFWSEEKRGANQAKGLPGRTTTMPVGAREAQVRDRHRQGLIPEVAPVRRRARLAPSPSNDAKSFEGEGPLLLHHEVDGSPELMSEDGKGVGLSMFFPKLFHEFLSGRVGPQEEHGGFGESPLQMDVSDFGSAGSQSFSRRALLAFHESSVGDEDLDAFEALDFVNLGTNVSRRRRRSRVERISGR